MIVSHTPRIRQTLLEIWRPLSILFLWDVVVTITYYLLPFHAPELPLTIFGSALALFLGVRGNSAYARWWEGRVLWGAMINASRNLARGAANFLHGDDAPVRDLQRSIVLRHLAYVNALRCQLRRQPAADEVARFLSPDEAADPLARTNIANGLLDGTGARIAQATREGRLDTIQQTQLEAVLVDIANAQGGMERLKNTPLPSQYRLIPDIFVRLFCVLLPIGLVETLGFATPIGSTVAGLMFLAAHRVGDDLTDPFANTPHDLPLSAMCRTIEIDLLQAIGDPAPQPAQPVKGVLW